MANQIKVTGLSPIVTGKKVTIDLDMGWKYLKVHVKRTNFTAAQATNYALKINGKIRQSLPSLADMEAINTHYGRPQVAGYTTIFFNRPELSDSEVRDLSGLGTRDIQTAQIEFILATGLTDPDVEVVAEVVTNEDIGWITMFENSDIALTKIGANVISKMPEGSGDVLSYIMQKATDDITDLNLIRVVDGNKTSVIESSKEFLELEQKQAPMKPRAPVTATQTVLDFTTSGVPTDALKTDYIETPEGDLVPVERIGLNITIGSAETLTVITESIGKFTG